MYVLQVQNGDSGYFQLGGWQFACRGHKRNCLDTQITTNKDLIWRLRTTCKTIYIASWFLKSRKDKQLEQPNLIENKEQQTMTFKT